MTPNTYMRLVVMNPLDNSPSLLLQKLDLMLPTHSALLVFFFFFDISPFKFIIIIFK